jgi:hypothetical protein
MTADLAYAIGDAGTQSVADPFLTALALGEGMRRIDSARVHALAQQIGARKIVTVYAGHDGHHKFTLTIQVAQADQGGPPWQRDWRAVPFTDEKTPAFVLHDMLPEVLKSLPLGLSAAKVASAPAATLPERIRGTPSELVKNSAPATAAPTVTLLASLAVGMENAAAERLFERALTISLRHEDDSAAGKFLTAYALLHLQRRPAALARLAHLEGPAAEALRALLDGNLPAARSATGKVSQAFEQFVLQLDLRDLEFAYDREDPSDVTAVTRLFAAPKAWATLIEQRSNTRDGWFVASAIGLKKAFDAAFPSQGLDAGSVVRGADVIGNTITGDVEIDIASGRHAQAVVQQLLPAACCRSNQMRAEQWDLLWLLQQATEARVSDAVVFTLWMQGLPDAALAKLARYEPFFDGHPALAVLHSDAALQNAEHSPDDERGSWLGKSRQYAQAASFWAQGQNLIGRAASNNLGVPSPVSQFWVDAYGYDYPRRADWPAWFFGAYTSQAAAEQALAFAREALAFTQSDLRFMQPLPEAERMRLLANVGTRFKGHPQRTELVPSPVMARAMTPEARFAAQIAEDPFAWEPRMALGRQIIGSGGPFEEAQKTILAWPGFKRTTRSPVGLSNNAYEAGSLFFWIGRSDLARPFYKIAADLDTGSEGSIESAQRLHLMDGQYTLAAEESLDRAVRCSSVYGYRDYLSLLHAFGERDAAWQGFSQVKAAFDVPQVWLAALVGQRIQGLDEPQVRAWLRTPEIRSSRFKVQRFASWYAVLWQSTDRQPTPDLARLVEELDGPTESHIDSDGVSVIRPHPQDPEGLELVRRSPTFEPAARAAEGTPVRSERAYFADAYVATMLGDYPTAVQRFAAMARYYPVHEVPLGYFAYAASKSGDTLKLEARLDGIAPAFGFDGWLARAFFAASHQKIEEAAQALMLASRIRPYTESRPVDTEFQYAQACEWLYRDTQDARFLTALMAWLKEHEVIQPTHGWAYAMQYTYEKNPSERIRALAMSRYLDPHSPRIRNASEADVKRADAWLKANNPFRVHTERSTGTARTAALATSVH